MIYENRLGAVNVGNWPTELPVNFINKEQCLSARVKYKEPSTLITENYADSETGILHRERSKLNQASLDLPQT